MYTGEEADRKAKFATADAKRTLDFRPPTLTFVCPGSQSAATSTRTRLLPSRQIGRNKHSHHTGDKSRLYAVVKNQPY